MSQQYTKHSNVTKIQYSKLFNRVKLRIPVERSVVSSMIKNKNISNTIFSQTQINLSGKYYEKWKFTGRVRMKPNQQKNDIHSHLMQLKFQEASDKDKQYQEEIKIEKISFFQLLKETKWEKLQLNAIRNFSINLMKQISCVYFPKLLKLELVGNNLTSIQLLQTLDLPYLQDLKLTFNKITNLKSIKKLNCFNLKLLDLRLNFLSIDKTYEGLTNFNGQKLRDVDFQFNQEPQTYQPFEERLAQQRRYQYRPDGQAISISQLIPRLSRDNWLNNQFIINKIRQLYQDKEYGYQVKIIDFLISFTLTHNSMLSKFLLKSNSQSQELFEVKRSCSNKNISPYQYFMNYSTNIDRFIEIYKQQREQYEERQKLYRELYYSYQYDNYLRYEQQLYQNQQQQLNQTNKVVTKRGFYYT